ncbi:hypothetical protein TRFO_10692 [Tritrichomonas foetus]|uniref:von Willebrand factor type A domain containing protein n=1 Tax=Tritrichomonas foetus TaxID=1144522 RepID=A0A1J4J8I1_9EUKA|nr:hypothetical protein TRFO_10692 [Tritrichomonas foetus]|eukprot:OHS95001.1 hypothetical protein TRFO_10692 [Tritrichomonas foetus]
MPFGSCFIIDDLSKKEINLFPKKIDIRGKKNGFICSYEVGFTYFNDLDYPVDLKYCIPIENDLCIHSIKAKTSDYSVEFSLRESSEAETIFKETTDYGIHGILIHSTDGLLTTISLGNLPPKSECLINFNVIMISTLNPDLKSIRTRFPLEICNNNGNIYNLNSGNITENNIIHYEMKIIEPFDIADISTFFSSTIEKIRENEYIVSNNNSLLNQQTQKELDGKEEEVHHQFIHDPTMNNEVIMYDISFKEEITSFISNFEEYSFLNFIPKLNNEENDPSVSQKKSSKKFQQEFIFIIDCSGSMQGSRINQAKECLKLLVHSLPVNCYYNIIQFGSDFKPFHPESVEYTKENVQNSLKKISQIQANLGGTEMLKPFEFIHSKKPKNCQSGNKRQLFLITDGADFHPDQVLNLIEDMKEFNRIFSIGIGRGADPKIIKRSSQITDGQYSFILDGADLRAKVIPQLNASMTKVIKNIQIHTENEESIKVVPYPIRNIALNIASYFIIRNENKSKIDENHSILLTGNYDEYEYEFIAETINQQSLSETNLDSKEMKAIIEKLFSFHEIQSLIMEINELQKQKTPEIESILKEKIQTIISISIKSGILCPYTSFVGIFKKNTENIKEYKNIYVEINNQFIPFQIPKNIFESKTDPNTDLSILKTCISNQMSIPLEKIKIKNFKTHMIIQDEIELQDNVKLSMEYVPIRSNVSININGRIVSIPIDQLDDFLYARKVINQTISDEKNSDPSNTKDFEIVDYNEITDGHNTISLHQSFRHLDLTKELHAVHNSNNKINIIIRRNNEKLPIECDPQITIDEMKELLKNKYKFDIFHDRMLFQGKTLRASDILYDRNISNNSEIYLARIYRGGQQLFVKTMNQNLSFDFDFVSHSIVTDSSSETNCENINQGKKVCDIKEMIEKETHIPKEYQRLIFGGKQMEDDHFISDYSILPNSTIYMLLRLKGGMQIHIKINHSGKSITLNVSPEEKIEEIRRQIFQIEGIPPEQQNLTFNGISLLDDHCLDYYNIEENSIIRVSLQAPAGKCCLSYSHPSTTNISSLNPPKTDFEISLLLDNHSIEGYWENLNEILRVCKLLNLTKEIIIEKISNFREKRKENEHEEDNKKEFENLDELINSILNLIKNSNEQLLDQILATIIAISILHEKAIDQEEIWCILEQKASLWFSSISTNINWKELISFFSFLIK